MREDIDVHNSICPMPRNLALQNLPYSVLRLLHGAEVRQQYYGKPDLVALFFNDEEEVLHVKDFERVKACAQKAWKEHVAAKKMETTAHTVPGILSTHRYVCKLLEEEYGEDSRPKVLMLPSDQYGCAYWRMIIPARHIDEEKVSVEVSSMEVVFEYLREYDTIVVQRVCNWNSYYVIQKLKQLGKRVVYDIDDNLYELPEYHPARNVFTRDNLESSRAIMGLVDIITVTTDEMAQALIKNVGPHVEEKIRLIPNTIDPDQFPIRDVQLGTEDPFRIVWAGSATHEYDFKCCSDALDKFLLDHPDDNIKLLFMGYLPMAVRRRAQLPHWEGRLEIVEFKEIETYFEMMRNIRADLAIAPLINLSFNRAKSCIKWIEYTLAGIPVVASPVGPYHRAIEHGKTGIHALSQEDWVAAFEDKFQLFMAQYIL